MPASFEARIYVGNLPPRATDLDVRRRFSEFGCVLDVETHRTFCFVQMEDARDADRAIQALHKRIFMGTVLTVEKSSGCPGCGGKHFARDCPRSAKRSRSRSRSPKRDSSAKATARRPPTPADDKPLAVKTRDPTDSKSAAQSESAIKAACIDVSGKMEPVMRSPTDSAVSSLLSSLQGQTPVADDNIAKRNLVTHKLLMDVTMSPAAIQVQADLPGFKREHVKVSVDSADNVLHVVADRARVNSDVEAALVFAERDFGRYERRVKLPKDADIDHVHANFEDGILTLTFGRRPKEGVIKQICL